MRRARTSSSISPPSLKRRTPRGRLVILVSALTLWLLPSLAACTAKNESFCAGPDDCNADQLCEGNVCIAAPDASPFACPSDSPECVPAVPEGWEGPAIVARHSGEALGPSCPPGYDTVPALLSFDGFGGEGSCTCSCGNALDITCSAANFEGRPDFGGIGACQQSCLAGSDDCASFSIAPNQCQAVGAATNKEVYKLRLGEIQSGLCGTASPQENFDPVSIESGFTLCVASRGDTCDAGGSCQVQRPEGFDDLACIYQEGDVDCPADSPYTEKLLSFLDVDDQRSCGDDCACGVEVGEPCGSVELSSAASICIGNAGLLDEGCTDNTSIDANFAEYQVVASEHACVQGVDLELTGEPVGRSPRTICCQR